MPCCTEEKCSWPAAKPEHSCDDVMDSAGMPSTCLKMRRRRLTHRSTKGSSVRRREREILRAIQGWAKADRTPQSNRSASAAFAHATLRALVRPLPFRRGQRFGHQRRGRPEAEDRDQRQAKEGCLAGEVVAQPARIGRAHRRADADRGADDALAEIEVPG